MLADREKLSNSKTVFPHNFCNSIARYQKVTINLLVTFEYRIQRYILFRFFSVFEIFLSKSWTEN